MNIQFIAMALMGLSNSYWYENSLSDKDNLKRAIRYSRQDLKEKSSEKGLRLEDFEGPVWRETGEPQKAIPPKFSIYYVNKKENLCYKYFYTIHISFLEEMKNLENCIPPKDTSDSYKFKGSLSEIEIENLLELES
jgi:hypothetical protein